MRTGHRFPDLSRPRALAAAALTAAFAWPASSQIRLPQPSPGSVVSQEIGISKVTITAHRPAVRGRTIWGGLVPYGEVWRLGANDAATFEVSHACQVAGKDLPAGRYALFALPGRDRWTLIVNREPKQWGAYFHKPEQDVLRFEVTPESGPMTEWMTFSIVPQEPGTLRVDWAWEKLRFSFPVTFDVPGIVWRQIDEALASAAPDDSATPLQAARYARQEGRRLDEGMTWLDRSIAIRESFWSLELKALYLDDRGRTAEAIPLLEKAIPLASKGGAPKAYVDGLEKRIAELKAKLGPPPR